MMIETDNSYPVFGSNGTGDFITGLGLAYAVVCALYKKKETGLGDYVENSLYGMGLWCTSNYNIGCLPQYKWKMPRRRDTCTPGSAPFKCKDGNWIMCAVVNIEAQWAGFANAIGKPEWAHHESTARPRARATSRSVRTSCRNARASSPPRPRPNGTRYSPTST